MTFIAAQQRKQIIDAIEVHTRTVERLTAQIKELCAATENTAAVVHDLTRDLVAAEMRLELAKTMATW